jgi:hypothetical protein
MKGSTGKLHSTALARRDPGLQDSGVAPVVLLEEEEEEEEGV